MDDGEGIEELVRLFYGWRFDINGRLTGAQGYVDLLLQGAFGELTPQQREILETQVLDRVRGAARVLDHAREYLHQRYDRVERWQPLPLAGIVSQAVSRFLEDRRAMRGTAEVPADLPPVRSIEALHFLFQDLIEQFRDRDPVQNISISAGLDGDEVVVRVRMALPLHPHEVEDPAGFFWPGSPVSAARQIVLRHGRELRVAEISEAGLTFQFSLPVWEE